MGFEKPDLDLQQRALEAVACAVLIADPQGTITWVNPAFTELTGFPFQEAVGRTPRILKSDRQPPELYKELWDTVLAGRVWTGELINRRKDGSEYTERQTITPILDEVGRVAHLVAIKEDLTERRQLERQLAESRKLESLGRLAGGVAHDFNNMLSVILGYSEMALATLPAEHALRGPLDRIRQAGEQSANLTGQLLAFGRRAILNAITADLNEVVSEANKLLCRVIGEDIAIVVSAQDGLWPTKVDAGQLQQVIVNLALNARDAMPQGGRLTIETKNVELDADYARAHPDVTPGPHVMLAVSDTGTGMDPATRVRVFEPFFTTKEQGKGTGLGLASVHGFVRQSGGSIWVYSEPGEGTTFKIYLPREQEFVPEGPRTQPLRRSGIGCETILLAEDSELVRDLASAALRSGGYTVLEARSGEEALALSRHTSARIDLLLSDVVMPDFGGAVLSERVRSDRPQIKTLLMSGYTENGIAEEYLQGGHGFISKPLRPKVLLRKVREVLDAQS